MRWCTQLNALLVERAAKREGTAYAGAPVLGTARSNWPDEVEHRTQEFVELEHSRAAAVAGPRRRWKGKKSRRKQERRRKKQVFSRKGKGWLFVGNLLVE